MRLSISLFAIVFVCSTIECHGQKLLTLNSYGGFAYFSGQGLPGLCLNVDLTYPVRPWFKIGVGFTSANAHNIHDFGLVEEKQYIIMYNALIAKGYFVPVHTRKHNVELGLGGLFHYTGFSYFIYREVRPVDSDDPYLIKEFYVSGKRGPNFVLLARYTHRLKTGRYYLGCQYDYHRYSSIHCASFLFGVDL